MLEHDAQHQQENAQISSNENQQTASEPPALLVALSEQPESTPVSSEAPVSSNEPEQQLNVPPDSKTDPSATASPLDQQAPAPAADASAPVEQLSSSVDNPVPADLASSPTVQSIQPVQPARRERLDRSAKVALCLALVLLLLGSSGLVYDLVYYQPAQASIAATATVNGQATGTTSAYITEIANGNATSTVQAQATAQAYQKIYQQATSGTPFLNDSLSHQTSSGWDEGQGSDKSSCGFKHGSYNAYTPHLNFFWACFEENISFRNFAFQVDMNILQGDYGGILFRADDYTGRFYLFRIDSSGDYNLYAYHGFSGVQSQTLLSGSTSFYEQGQANQLTLVATRNSFYFYLNQHFLDSTTDETFESGLIALIAKDSTQPTDVAFNNAKVWQLS